MTNLLLNRKWLIMSWITNYNNNIWTTNYNVYNTSLFFIRCSSIKTKYPSVVGEMCNAGKIHWSRSSREKIFFIRVLCWNKSRSIKLYNIELSLTPATRMISQQCVPFLCQQNRSAFCGVHPVTVWGFCVCVLVFLLLFVGCFFPKWCCQIVKNLCVDCHFLYNQNNLEIPWLSRYLSCRKYH